MDPSVREDGRGRGFHGGMVAGEGDLRQGDVGSGGEGGWVPACAWARAPSVSAGFRGGMGPRIREDKGGGEVFTPIQTFPRRGERVPACGDLCVTTKTHSDSGVGRLLSQPNHGILDSGFRRNDGYAKVSIREDKRGGDGIDGDAADGGRGERMGSRMRVDDGGGGG